MDEYEKLEVELKKCYEDYMVRFRCLAFLEQQVEERGCEQLPHQIGVFSEASADNVAMAQQLPDHDGLLTEDQDFYFRNVVFAPKPSYS